MAAKPEIRAETFMAAEKPVIRAETLMAAEKPVIRAGTFCRRKYEYKGRISKRKYR